MGIIVRRAQNFEKSLLVEHYVAVCESYRDSVCLLRSDIRQVIDEFFEEGLRTRELAAFFAERENFVCGSLICQVQILPYPDVVRPSLRKHGYIWSVYVSPEFRRQGIGSILLQAGVAYLRFIGCTVAVLHSADDARPMYERAGFTQANEMRLNLS